LWCKGEPLYKMTNTQSFAKQELNILKETTPDAVITPFTKEILALCEAFGKSGQSGGSAPYTANALSQAIKKLCLQEPICDVTGHEREWVDISEWSGKTICKIQGVADFLNTQMANVVITMLLYGKEKKIGTHLRVEFILTINILN